MIWKNAFSSLSFGKNKTKRRPRTNDRQNVERSGRSPHASSRSIQMVLSHTGHNSINLVVCMDVRASKQRFAWHENRNKFFLKKWPNIQKPIRFTGLVWNQTNTPHPSSRTHKKKSCNFSIVNPNWRNNSNNNNNNKKKAVKKKKDGGGGRYRHLHHFFFSFFLVGYWIMWTNKKLITGESYYYYYQKKKIKFCSGQRRTWRPDSMTHTFPVCVCVCLRVF